MVKTAFEYVKAAASDWADRHYYTPTHDGSPYPQKNISIAEHFYITIRCRNHTTKRKLAIMTPPTKHSCPSHYKISKCTWNKSMTLLSLAVQTHIYNTFSVSYIFKFLCWVSGHIQNSYLIWFLSLEKTHMTRGEWPPRWRAHELLRVYLLLK